MSLCFGIIDELVSKFTTFNFGCIRSSMDSNHSLSLGHGSEVRSSSLTTSNISNNLSFKSGNLEGSFVFGINGSVFSFGDGSSFYCFNLLSIIMDTIFCNINNTMVESFCLRNNRSSISFISCKSSSEPVKFFKWHFSKFFKFP